MSSKQPEVSGGDRAEIEILQTFLDAEIYFMTVVLVTDILSTHTSLKTQWCVFSLVL